MDLTEVLEDSADQLPVSLLAGELVLGGADAGGNQVQSRIHRIGNRGDGEAIGGTGSWKDLGRARRRDETGEDCLFVDRGASLGTREGDVADTDGGFRGNLWVKQCELRVLTDKHEADLMGTEMGVTKNDLLAEAPQKHDMRLATINN